MKTIERLTVEPDETIKAVAWGYTSLDGALSGQMPRGVAPVPTVPGRFGYRSPADRYKEQLLEPPLVLNPAAEASAQPAVP
jgi:hypothetical protein